MAKGSNFEIFRVKQGLYQKELAEICGVSVAEISLIENGKRKGGLKFWHALKEAFTLSDAEIEKLKKQ